MVSIAKGVGGGGKGEGLGVLEEIEIRTSGEIIIGEDKWFREKV